MWKVDVGSIKITPETTQKRQKLAQLLHWVSVCHIKHEEQTETKRDV